MTAKPGREFTIKQGAAVILAGIQTKSVEHANEAIDITSDDDSGWQTLMPKPGKKSVNISFSGISKSAMLRDAAMNGESCMLEGVTVTYADGGTIAGDFFLSSLSYEGEHSDAVKISGELMSSGPITSGAAA